MSVNLTGVHEYRRQPGTQLARLVKSRPYVRYSHGPVDVFIQEGRLLTESGEYGERPGWLKKQIEITSEEVLDETGARKVLDSWPKPSVKKKRARKTADG